jgi:hypothetical protein
MEVITKEEFGMWKQDRITQHVMGILKDVRKEWEEALLSGRTLRCTNPDHITAESIGVLKGLDYLLEIQWEDEDAVEKTGTI